MRCSVSRPVLSILQRRRQLPRCAMFAGGQQQPLHSPLRLPCKRVAFKIGYPRRQTSPHKPGLSSSSPSGHGLEPVSPSIRRPFIFDGDWVVICLGRIGLLVEKPVLPAGQLPSKAHQTGADCLPNKSRRRLRTSANRARESCQRLPLESRWERVLRIVIATQMSSIAHRGKKYSPLHLER